MYRLLNVIVKYSERVLIARMHELASASPPYERVPNILRYTFNNLLSSPEPKAHGELIGYPWSGVRRPSVVHNFKHLQNRFADHSQIYVEPP